MRPERVCFELLVGAGELQSEVGKSEGIEMLEGNEGTVLAGGGKGTVLVEEEES